MIFYSICTKFNLRNQWVGVEGGRSWGQNLLYLQLLKIAFKARNSYKTKLAIIHTQCISKQRLSAVLPNYVQFTAAGDPNFFEKSL